jgi:hypothetical protein
MWMYDLDENIQHVEECATLRELGDPIEPGIAITAGFRGGGESPIILSLSELKKIVEVLETEENYEEDEIFEE